MFAIDIDAVVKVYRKQDITDSHEISDIFGVENYD